MMPSAGNRKLSRIEEADCLPLLATQSLGRVAYVSDGRPMIVPVDFIVFEDLIAFRTDPGDKHSHVPLSEVCFEADGSDGRDGLWSVVVHGPARDVTTALNDQFERLRQSTIATEAPLTDPHWIAIEIEEISGRRLST